MNMINTTKSMSQLLWYIDASVHTHLCKTLTTFISATVVPVHPFSIMYYI